MSKMLYDGFHKIEETSSMLKGQEVTREKLHLPSAVAGLVYSSKGYALVSQYRPVIEKETKEIPAGILDKDLPIKEILIEELEEEAGIARADILRVSNQPFAEYYMVTGSSDAKTYLFEVEVTPQEDRMVSEDLDVDYVEWVSLEQWQYYKRTGQIVDAKTLLALEHALRKEEQNGKI